MFSQYLVLIGRNILLKLKQELVELQELHHDNYSHLRQSCLTFLESVFAAGLNQNLESRGFVATQEDIDLRQINSFIDCKLEIESNMAIENISQIEIKETCLLLIALPITLCFLHIQSILILNLKHLYIFGISLYFWNLFYQCISNLSSK